METEPQFVYTPSEAAENFFKNSVYARNTSCREMAYELMQEGKSPSEALREFTKSASIEQFATLIAEEHRLVGEWTDIDLRNALMESAERHLFESRLQLNRGKLRLLKLTDESRRNIYDRMRPLEVLSLQLVQRRSSTRMAEKR